MASRWARKDSHQLYHSDFYDLLYEINKKGPWRKLLARPEPDLHMKDIEILLRGFAVLIEGANYAPSMVKFLNQSNKCKKLTLEQNKYRQRDRGLVFTAVCEFPGGTGFLDRTAHFFSVRSLCRMRLNRSSHVL